MADDLHRPRLHMVLLVATASLLLAGCAADDEAPAAGSAATVTNTPMAESSMTETMGEQKMDSMGDMAADAPRLPPVLGYHDGEQVLFVHPEASDPDIAQTLEGMMGSPVPVVPSLADTPEDARSPLYVFTNGVTPEDTPAGPLGFQPDVFATAPGDEGYTPLRELVLVTWVEDAEPRVLTSKADVDDAEAVGEVTFEQPGVVINAPLLTWPEGQR